MNCYFIQQKIGSNWVTDYTFLNKSDACRKLNNITKQTRRTTRVIDRLGSVIAIHEFS